MLRAIMEWIVLIAVYFMPTMVAWRRHHHNAAAIGVLNLLTGWTIVGWVSALVWAFTAVRPRRAA